MYGGLNIDSTERRQSVTATRHPQLPKLGKNGDGLFRKAGEAVRQLCPFSEQRQAAEQSGSA
jgi:hypothetical protein